MEKKFVFWKIIDIIFSVLFCFTVVCVFISLSKTEIGFAILFAVMSSFFFAGIKSARKNESELKVGDSENQDENKIAPPISETAKTELVKNSTQNNFVDEVYKKIAEAQATKKDEPQEVGVEKSFKIKYYDYDDNQSEREIVPRRIELKKDGLFVVAFCLLRKEIRNFNFGRMTLLDKDAKNEFLNLLCGLPKSNAFPSFHESIGGMSYCEAWKRFNKLQSIGASSDELERLENLLDSNTIYYFLPDLDPFMPSKFLECAGKFLADDSTVEKFILTKYGIHSEKSSRYDDVLSELKHERKNYEKLLAFRRIIESTDLSLAQKLDNLNESFETQKTFYSNLFELKYNENWKSFKIKKLSFGDFLIALSYEKLGNPKAFELYLAGYKTLEDYEKLTDDILKKEMNFRVSKTRSKILKSRDVLKKAQKNFLLFDPDVLLLKKISSYNEIDYLSLAAKDTLI